MMPILGKFDRPEDTTSAQQERRHFRALESEARRRRRSERKARIVQRLRESLLL